MFTPLTANGMVIQNGMIPLYVVANARIKVLSGFRLFTQPRAVTGATKPDGLAWISTRGFSTKVILGSITTI